LTTEAVTSEEKIDIWITDKSILK